jgi:glycine/D-amino acid oxidase-like deaminating enzyme
VARAGKTDLLLLERAEEVGQATTSQGAGLCGQPRDSVERIRLAMHSVATFRELQKDPEVKPDWHEVGSLRIALSERRAVEFRRLKQAAMRQDWRPFHRQRRSQRRWPLMDLNQAKAVSGVLRWSDDACLREGLRASVPQTRRSLLDGHSR